MQRSTLFRGLFVRRAHQRAMASVQQPCPVRASSAEVGTALMAVARPVPLAATVSVDATPLNGLLALGFSERSALQLVETYPLERVQRALNNLPLRKARNPAGYLLRELQAGGYAEAEARLTPVRRPIGLPQPTAEQRADSEKGRLKVMRCRKPSQRLTRRCVRSGGRRPGASVRDWGVAP
jgi:hypothetical protein